MVLQSLDLKGIIQPLAPTLIRKATSVIAGAILSIGPTGLLSSDDATKIATGVIGVLVLIGSTIWTRYAQKQDAIQTNAAAATGDPRADPADPVVQAKIASAISNPLSPVTAKVAP